MVVIYNKNIGIGNKEDSDAMMTFAIIAIITEVNDNGNRIFGHCIMQTRKVDWRLTKIREWCTQRSRMYTEKMPYNGNENCDTFVKLHAHCGNMGRFDNNTEHKISV